MLHTKTLLNRRGPVWSVRVAVCIPSHSARRPMKATTAYWKNRFPGNNKSPALSSNLLSSADEWHATDDVISVACAGVHTHVSSRPEFTHKAHPRRKPANNRSKNPPKYSGLQVFDCCMFISDHQWFRQSNRSGVSMFVVYKCPDNNFGAKWLLTYIFGIPVQIDPI